jgi:hypothetical protein
MKNNEKSPIVAPPAADELTHEQVVLLETAVEKLVRLAGRVGVTPDEMIALLDSGLDMRELLDYIASKTA